MSRSAELAPAAASSGPPTDTTRAMAGTLVAVAGLGTLAWVTLFHPSASRIYTWPMSAAVTALWLLPIATLLTLLRRAPAWRLPPSTVSVGLLGLTIATVSSAALSPFAQASLPRIWPTLGGVSLYLLLHHACAGENAASEARAARIARILGFAGVLFSLTSLVEWSQGSWPLPWGSRNTAPFGHSIYTAGAAVFVLPWIVLQTLLTRGVLRGVCVLGASATVVVLIGTSSRGGVLALAATGAVAAVLVLVRSHWTRPQKLLLVLGLCAVGLVVVFTNPRLRELAIHRRWPEVARESNEQRRAMFEAGLRLGQTRPLLGWGPGTVPLAYPHVRAALDGGTENILQLHNTPAQVFATTGGLGFLSLLLILAGTAASALRARRTPIAYAAAASLFGYGLFSLTDHQLDLPVFGAMAAASLALLTAQNPTSPRRLPPGAIRIGFGVLLVVGSGLAARSTFLDLRARQLYERALTALSENRPDDYLRALDAATSATPHDPFFDHQAAAWLLEQRPLVREPAKQSALTREAITRLERSLATGAHREYPHFNLGWLLLDTQPAEAARHFIAVVRCVPDKGGVYFGLGLAFNAQGNPTAARRCFALELINDPRQLTAPAWELPALAALRPAVQEEAIQLYTRLRGEAAGAATIAAWTRWWRGDPVSPAELRPGFNAESARLTGALPAMMKRDALAPTGDPWTRAYLAWRASSGRSTPDPSAFAALTGNDRDYATALARRAQRTDDFRTFLAAPVGDDAALLRTLRRQRTGYGLLALHPEGPPISDVFVVQENRVISDFATGLFPAKGWIPGRFLLALLPDAP